MGKRSKFPRRRQDQYDTPPEALAPLLPYLPKDVLYAEPCAGCGMLVDALEAAGRRVLWATDIEPRRDGVGLQDALAIWNSDLAGVHTIVTNPPWTVAIRHPMIERFRLMRPTWLLMDAAWMHTKQAIPHLAFCQTIVSVGRVSWMQNGVSSLDDCAWYLFGRDPVRTEFVGRSA